MTTEHEILKFKSKRIVDHWPAREAIRLVIKGLKDKYSIQSEEESTHGTDFHRVQETLREHEQHLSGLNVQLQELRSKVEITEESVCAERQLLNAKLQELNMINERLNELKTDKKSLLHEVHQLEMQRNGLRNAKPNVKDQQTIEHGRKKFKYYKQLTCIRWDFGAPKGISKGYVTNDKDYIQSFNYKTDQHGDKLQDLLWREIEKATGSSEFAENDENRVPNDS